MSLEWDDSHPPVVVVTLPPGAPRDSDVDGLLGQLEALHAAGRPFLLVIDARRLSMPITTYQRRMISSHRFAPEERARRARVRMGDVIVTSNPLVRGTLAALQWMTTFSVPKVAVSSMAEGLPFVDARLAAFGLELPESTRAFLAGS